MSPTTSPAADSSSHAPASAPTAVVFYDGECALCNRLVRFVLKRDRRGAFSFAPIQGETYARHFGTETPRDPDTMILVDDRGRHVRSDASLRILCELGGVWGPLGRIGLAFPRILRDPVYRLIARKRIAIFGRACACELPPPELRGRLLP